MLRLSRQEFHCWTEGKKGRYERIAGEPIAMSPERVVHARVKFRIQTALDQAIRAKNLDCELLPDGITIEIDDDTDYEPDALVNCGPRLPPDATAASNPVIIVEVSSPSTQSIDNGEKLGDYFRVPSVQHYLVVRSRKQEIIHHFRRGEEIISRPVNVGTIELDPPGISISIADIYAD